MIRPYQCAFHGAYEIIELRPDGWCIVRVMHKDDLTSPPFDVVWQNLHGLSLTNGTYRVLMEHFTKRESVIEVIDASAPDACKKMLWMLDMHSSQLPRWLDM